MRAHRNLRIKDVVLSLLAATLFAGTALLPNARVWAQPDCNWDCRSFECCGREIMCGNGSAAGTYGMYCATFCAGLSVPIGTACPY